MTTPRISFEFFPPRNIEASFRLWDAVTMLEPLGPDFVSVTYGAGGSTRQLTHEAVTAISRRTSLRVAAHLTCLAATREETIEIASDYAAAGVRDIVALRGDPAEGQGAFAPHPGGFEGSVDLVRALAETGRYRIRVGAYPDRHPEARDDDADIEMLKRKIDAGAHSAITQFFFEAETFLRFRDRATAAGITAEIIPGILPIENWANTRRFAARCNAAVPGWLADAFDKAVRDDRSDLLAISVATELCDDLMSEGAQALHFYTLNRPHLTAEICTALGVRPRAPIAKVA